MLPRSSKSFVAILCGLSLCIIAASAAAATRATKAVVRVSGHGELTVTLHDAAKQDHVAVYVDGRLVQNVTTQAGRQSAVHVYVGRGTSVLVDAVGQHQRPQLAVKVKRKSQAKSADDSPDPSGEAMPVGDLPGWRQVFTDDFNGTSLGSCWYTYNGVIPSSPTSMWAPSHVSVSGGEAMLSTYQDSAFGGTWTAGGMSSAPCLQQEYGKYEVRFRMDQAPGVKYAILLWPSTKPWPCGGEIDFGEDQGGDRNYSTLTDNYCNASGQHVFLPQDKVYADFSQWHTIGVEWTHDKLVWTLDGKTIATVNSDKVPADDMQLDIQAEANTNCSISWYTCVDAATPPVVHTDIDWVAAWAPTS
jgi:beta-glucanase (GH16 family)